jgi:putative membrane protein
MIRRFLVKIIVCALALWAADYMLSGLVVGGGIQGYLIAGAALGILNTFIRPLLKLLAMPLIALTLGLFTLVINAALLWFVGDILDIVSISGLWTLLAATLIISIVSMLFDPSTD